MKALFNGRGKKLAMIFLCMLIVAAVMGAYRMLCTYAFPAFYQSSKKDSLDFAAYKINSSAAFAASKGCSNMDFSICEHAADALQPLNNVGSDGLE